MKTNPSPLRALALTLPVAFAPGLWNSASAETVFTQDFENGLGITETTFGAFSINDTLASLNNGTLVMGHASAYGALGSAATPLPTYSYYEVVLDLRGFTDAELRFDFSGAIEKAFDGFNLLATTDPTFSPPDGLITPTAGSEFQYDDVPLTQHGASSPELGAIAWSSPADPSVVVKDLAAVFDLSAFDEQKVRVRFQFGTDAFEGGEGANFDNIVVEGTALPDTDGDGMPDSFEDSIPGLDSGSDDSLLDLDNDGVNNITEFNNCTDLDNPDTDGDDLSDAVETGTGTFVSAEDSGSNPLIADTDGDGLDDGIEVNNIGTDPNKVDTDGDGFDDKREIDLGSDPTNGLDKPKVWVVEDLGTGTGALIGGDLTDPEDDGVEGTVPGNGDWSSLNWNWVSIEASQENYFGNFGGSEGAYDIFDNNVGPAQAKWCCGGAPQWITVEFEKAISLESFTVTSGNDVPARDPLVWTISGSNDGENFDLIFEQDDTTSLWPQRLQVLHFIAPRPVKAYKFLRYDVIQTGNANHQINEIEYFGSTTVPTFFFEVDQSGDELVFTWESEPGLLYNLLSVTDPSGEEPALWPVFAGNQDIAATPPLNTLTIPFPDDPTRYFAIESFPTPPTKIYTEDFENGQGSWTTGSLGAATTTEWELGTPDAGVTGGPPSANSGANVFGTDLDASYADETEVFLRSPAIDLSVLASGSLIYSRYIDIEATFDAGSVRILNASDDSEIAVLEDAIDGSPGAWEEVSLDLPVEAIGKSVKIEFLFQADDFNGSPQAGFYIDDVCVAGSPL